MPSFLHDGLLQLFRDRPSLAPELVRDVLHQAVPAFTHVRIGDASLTEVVPTEYRADLVLLLEDRDEKTPRGALVVEAQLGRDPDKRWSWPVYLAGLRARLHCNVVLLVVTDDAAVAAWAATPIVTGHPGWVLVPLVLGPGVVPVVKDEGAATRAPELAVLSAIVHAHGAAALDVARAAIAAARELDEERCALYFDLVLSAAGTAERAILEALTMIPGYQYQSEFARRYVAEGRAEGLAEGRGEALLKVLEARGIPVSDQERSRILACRDVAQLDAWIVRAATAQTAAGALGD